MNTSGHRSNSRSDSFLKRRRWAVLFVCAVASLLIQGAGLASDPQQVFQKVQQDVAANPTQANAIVKSALEGLPPGERQSLASGVLAAGLKGLGNPTPAQALALFTTAFKASPSSIKALLTVVHRAFPKEFPEFMEAAIKAAEATGESTLIPQIVSYSVYLAPDQRAELTSLALSLTPESLHKDILDAIAALRFGDHPGPGGLGGTGNPRNNGGPVNSNERP